MPAANEAFMSFISNLCNASPSVRRSYGTHKQVKLYHMDGTRMADLWYDSKSPFNLWRRVKSYITEEFECDEDDITCGDWSLGPEDYEGTDAGKDKIIVSGKPVGFVA